MSIFYGESPISIRLCYKNFHKGCEKRKKNENLSLKEFKHGKQNFETIIKELNMYAIAIST